MKKIGIVLVLILIQISFVLASDVAYVYKSENNIDDNVLEIFDGKGLSVDLIQEDNLPNSFSNYKLIFVGDERFRNEDKIPVNEYPSIISNYYYGEEWGLTDNDGISKLASNNPLSVRKGNKVIQVYNQAKFDGKTISLPYYYLDDKNRVSGMEKVAGVHTGNNYDFGDVISYSNEGTHLINGKSARGNICFFGIIESDYWTSGAEELFKDCVDFVVGDSDVVCFEDSDCQDGFYLDNPFCDNNDLFDYFTSYSCLYPGTEDSKCVGSTDPRLIYNCKEGCSNGECLDECSYDSECGTDYYSDNYCQGGDLYRDFHEFSCLNKKCIEEVDEELVEECSEDCSNEPPCITCPKIPGIEGPNEPINAVDYFRR